MQGRHCRQLYLSPSVYNCHQLNSTLQLTASTKQQSQHASEEPSITAKGWARCSHTGATPSYTCPSNAPESSLLFQLMLCSSDTARGNCSRCSAATPAVGGLLKSILLCISPPAASEAVLLLCSCERSWHLLQTCFFSGLWLIYGDMKS